MARTCSRPRQPGSRLIEVGNGALLELLKERLRLPFQVSPIHK
jgi:hypothetical protein